jgi:hypothetical protein
MILFRRPARRLSTVLLWLVSHGGLCLQFLIGRALFGFWPALITCLVIWAWLTASVIRSVTGMDRTWVAGPVTVVELDSRGRVRSASLLSGDALPGERLF